MINKYNFSIMIFMVLLFSSLSFAFKLDEPFVREVRNKNKELQLAAKSYKLRNKTITLLAAQHYGVKSLYERHQEILDSVDLVLFEGQGDDSEGDNYRKN
jgi:hypothetical protein